MIAMVAYICDDRKRNIGVRLVDTDENRTKDVSNKSIVKGLEAGIKIYNMQLVSGRASVIGGKDGYPVMQFKGGIVKNESNIILLKDMGTGYMVCDGSGSLRNISMNELKSYADRNQIANVKSIYRGEIQLKGKKGLAVDDGKRAEAVNRDEAKSKMLGKSTHTVDKNGILVQISDNVGKTLRIPEYVRGMKANTFASIMALIQNEKAPVIETVYTGENNTGITDAPDKEIAIPRKYTFLECIDTRCIRHIVFQNDEFFQQCSKYLCSSCLDEVTIPEIISSRSCMKLLGIAYNLNIQKINLGGMTWESVGKGCMQYIKDRYTEMNSEMDMVFTSGFMITHPMYQKEKWRSIKRPSIQDVVQQLKEALPGILISFGDKINRERVLLSNRRMALELSSEITQVSLMQHSDGKPAEGVDMETVDKYVKLVSMQRTMINEYGNACEIGNIQIGVWNTFSRMSQTIDNKLHGELKAITFNVYHRDNGVVYFDNNGSISGAGIEEFRDALTRADDAVAGLIAVTKGVFRYRKILSMDELIKKIKAAAKKGHSDVGAEGVQKIKENIALLNREAEE